MALLYDRRCRVTFSTPSDTAGNFKDVLRDELVVEAGEGGNHPAGLRVSFKISKTDGKEPNTAEITVTNLNDDSRGQLQKKGLKVVLEAGYNATGVARLHRGDARTVDHVRDKASWNTIVKCGDGERAYKHARVAESFAAGTGAGDVLTFLANASGLQVGNVPTVVANLTTRYDQGYVVSGRWSDEMDRLVKAIGYGWSIQDETLQVLLPGQATNGQIPLISVESGLIGSPEFGTPEKKGKPALVKFQSLLMPTTPGAKVHLKSERYDGDVRVKKCSFEGDTHGGPWFTSYEGVILK